MTDHSETPDDIRQALSEVLLTSEVPPTLHAGLLDYIVFGVRPGSFLLALLSNDLFDAIARADAVNIYCLAAIAKFLRVHAPDHCYGSAAMVGAWLGVKGLRNGV